MTEDNRTEMRFVATLGAVKFTPPKTATSNYGDPTPKGGAIELPLSVKRPQLPRKPMPHYRMQQWERGRFEAPTEESLRDAWDTMERAAWLRERKGKGATRQVPCDFDAPEVDGYDEPVKCINGTLATAEGVELLTWPDPDDDGIERVGTSAPDTVDEDEVDGLRCPRCHGRAVVEVPVEGGKAEPTAEEEAAAVLAYATRKGAEYSRELREYEKAKGEYAEQLAEWQQEVAALGNPFKTYAMLAAIAALLGGGECEVIIRPLESDVLPGFSELFLGDVPQIEAAK